MILLLSPIRGAAPLRLERRGALLLLNGCPCDLSQLAEGEARSPEDLACPGLAGPVTRQEGVLHVPLLLPHGPEAPAETLFPAPLRLTGDGPVRLPPYGPEG